MNNTGPTEGIKYMDIKCFLEDGYLQEVNRLFFHPMGLALEVLIDDDGEYSLSGVWDYRGDPEGMIFGDCEERLEERKRKAVFIKAVWNERILERLEKLGFGIQPVDGKIRSLFEL